MVLLAIVMVSSISIETKICSRYLKQFLAHSPSISNVYICIFKSLPWKGSPLDSYALETMNFKVDFYYVPVFKMLLSMKMSLRYQ